MQTKILSSLPPLALLTVPQEVIGGQEGFARDRLPVLRRWLQAHVDPLDGSPAVKLLIVKHLREDSRSRAEAARPDSPCGLSMRG